ncbi:MAG: hypothetical protein WKF87_14055 [Chryseolinea sp.]
MLIRIAFILAFTASPSIYAQVNNVTKKHYIGLSAGYNFSALNDHNFAPLLYYERGKNYLLYYVGVSDKSILSADVNFSNGKLKTKASRFFESKYFKGEIDLSYLRSAFTSANSSMVHYFGAGIHSYNHYIDYDDQESFSFIMAHSIDFKYTASYKLSTRNNLQLQISLPFVVLLVRPPYNGYDEELKENRSNPFSLITNGRVTSINNYFAISNQLIYSYSLSQRFDINCKYKFGLVYAPIEERLVHIHNEIFIGASFIL